MSRWCYELKVTKQMTCEWNMFFATMGHNVCDGHAGHQKRYTQNSIYFCSIHCFNESIGLDPVFPMFTTPRAVREAEANYEHMKDVDSIIPCMTNLKNTTSYHLTPEQIEECDEDVAKAKGKGWVKKYHHFSYVKPGVINCKYVRGKGAYQQHHIVQIEGISLLLLLNANRLGVREDSLTNCGFCGCDDEFDDDGTDWVECEKCKQWFHCACIGIEDEDEASFFFECDKCLKSKKNNK